MNRPDPSLDTPAVGPEYAGTPDAGVVSSVGEHARAAGDVVDVLRAEHAKLHGVFDEVLALVRTDDSSALRLRWGGIVRELLEHETAEQRVALPAAAQVAGDGRIEQVRRRSQEVIDRLRRHDTLTPEQVTPQEVSEAVDLVVQHLRVVEATILPLLAELPADHRMRLGEDLRQVSG
jgi:hemerythrin superfamily protein